MSTDKIVIYGAATPNCIWNLALAQNMEQNHRLCKAPTKLGNMEDRCSVLAAYRLNQVILNTFNIQNEY